MAQPAQQIAELFGILRRRKAWILIPPLITSTLAFVLAALLPRQFEANTIIEIREVVLLDDPDVQDLREHPITRNLPLLPARLRDLRLLREVIREKLQWESYTKVRTDQNAEFEYLKDVAGRIIVDVARKRDQVGNDRVFIGYRDANPDRTADFVRELSRTWMTRTRSDYVQYVEEQRNNLRADWQRKSRDVAQIYEAIHEQVRDNNLPLSAADLNNQQGRFFRDPVETELDRLRQALGVAQGNLTQLLPEIERERAILDRIPEFVNRKEIQRARLRDGAGPFANYVVQLLAQKAQYQTLIAGKTAIHPDVRRYQREITKIDERVAEIQKQLDVDEEATEEDLLESNPEYIDQNKKVLDLIARRDTAQAEIERLEGELARKGNERDEKSKAYQTVEEYKNNLREMQLEERQMLLAYNRKELSLNRLQSEQGNPFEVIQPPIKPNKPIWPSVPLIVTLGIVLGLMIGFALAFLTEFGRLSFRTMEDAARSLSVPVLGAVNLILTPSQMRRRRLSRVATALGLLLFLGALVGFAYLYAKHPEQLPREVTQFLDGIIKGEA